MARANESVFPNSFRNLRDMDMFSKSDPFVVVFVQPFGGTKWAELARTEVVMNNLNPEFANKVRVAYLFEEQQHLRFEVYDLDSKSNRLKDHDFIGAGGTTLGQERNKRRLSGLFFLQLICKSQTGQF
jgi:Ca2+-dependent lipid-binding protein